MATRVLCLLVFWCSLLLVRTNELNNTQSSSCLEVQQIFAMKKLGPSSMVPNSTIEETSLEICSPLSSSCCTRSMEEHYKLAVSRDLQGVLQASTASLKNLIASHASSLQESFDHMLQAAHNNTILLFTEVYVKMWPAAAPPLTKLFSELSLYIRGKDVELPDAVDAFFDFLFPLVYHHSINPTLNDFSDDYKECLQETQAEILPFGDIPRRVSLHVTKSLTVARTLVQALHIAVEVLNSTDHAGVSAECERALVRLSYCSHCQGLTQVRSCSGYCLNVVRGCLAAAAELDRPWNDLVISLQRVAASMKGANSVEEVLGVLDSKISEAIMAAMENGPELSAKVKKACGHAKRSVREARTSEGEVGSPVSSTVRNLGSPISPLIQELMKHLAQSVGFYGTLDEKLCSDDSMAVSRETDCWNGESVGEYSKTVAGVGLSAQKHNPELKLSRSGNLKISQLSDKLRHVKQMLTARLTPTPESDSLMVSDGSGGGGGWRYHSSDDEDYDDGSGSGMTPEPKTPGDRTGRPSKPTSKGGSGVDTDDINFDDSDSRTTGVTSRADKDGATTLLTSCTLLVTCLALALLSRHQ